MRRKIALVFRSGRPSASRRRDVETDGQDGDQAREEGHDDEERPRAVVHQMLDVASETVADRAWSTRHGLKDVRERRAGDFAAAATIERHLTPGRRGTSELPINRDPGAERGSSSSNDCTRVPCECRVSYKTAAPRRAD